MRRKALRWKKIAIGAVAVLLLALLAAWEWRTSALQARYVSDFAQSLRYRVEPGPSSSIRFPEAGPSDERLGYTRLPEYVERLRAQGYELSAQARQSQNLLDYTRRGFFAAYPEKTQAGLRVLDCRGAPLFVERYPQRVYADFDAIPPLLVDTLAFIEDRELLAAPEPKHNPVVDLPRLTKAVAGQAIALVDPAYPAGGGSTLATQIEKYRHSPGGRTASVGDKLRQMVSASVRVYQHGEQTLGARRRIVTDYVNTVPLGAIAGHGEVHGIGDGLWMWWGADFDATNRALRLVPADEAQLQAQALALRQVLGLIIAQRRPTFYLGERRPQLDQLSDSYLRLLADAGVISTALGDAALPLRPALRTEVRAARAGDFTAQKAANLVRLPLVRWLGTQQLYDLDRLDLAVDAGIDGALQAAVSEVLRGLRERDRAKAAGLVGHGLLERGDPDRLVYSFTLYERTAAGNRLRVQADNLDQPFDITAGSKLELGSTAKLRTLITYLEIVADLHERYAGMDAAALHAVQADRRDRLTRWALAYLAGAPDRSLAAMLEAAMQRRYSAHPGETFFTGGSLHTFENFRREDNDRNPTVAEALQDSINLAFIRLMRDVVQHYIYRDANGTARALEDVDDPQRTALLARFADREGSAFIRQFHRKYQGKHAIEILESLAARARGSREGLAAVFRTLAPNASLAAFEDFLRDHLPAHALPPAQAGSRTGHKAAHKTPARHRLAALYERHAPGRYSLADRGYLARVHPLELWVAAYLYAHLDAPIAQLLAASRAQRQEAYGWLFQARARAAQDRRIASLLELDAFAEIHRAWQRLGYPFDSLVPSYATAIGSSADRPSALAELMGIILNDGLRQPAVRIEQLRFAAGTPYETVLRRRPAQAERVLAPEIAATVRRTLEQVVGKGTARRLRGALDLPDGTRVAVGGKTGTGDNRADSYAAGGRLIGSRLLNRTATFVFFAGPRHFGTVTAYVPGPDARGYRFTSALPVQVLKTLAPLLRPVVSASEPAPEATQCTAGPASAKPFAVRRAAPFELEPAATWLREEAFEWVHARPAGNPSSCCAPSAPQFRGTPRKSHALPD